jgi:hypothetical protein
MDILWVIDNSGSMATSQQALADNFRRFIQNFDQKGFDYRMAVTTTDAYRDLFGAPATQSRFRDGTNYYGHTGVYIMTPTTPNPEQTFLLNVKQGVSGDGDERAFKSIKRTLLNPSNAGFPRSDAFLTIIILSDEDDFSHDGSSSLSGQYTNPLLHKTQSYVDFLDQVTGATAADRKTKYQVDTIAALDEACRSQLAGSNGAQKIAQRYIEMADLTGGIKGSICADFGSILSAMSAETVERATEFFLDRIPDPATIVVIVNNVNIPNDATNGYQYHADKNSITFHGTAIPGPGASISVKFDPVSLR